MGSNSIETRRCERVTEAAGNILTAADLPPRTLKRWVARKKADVVAAVEGGLLSEFEALARYNISRDEFQAWLRAYRKDGVPGLRVKAAAQHEDPTERSRRGGTHPSYRVGLGP